MSADERYDDELQMYVDEPRDAKHEHLLFLRWLLEQEKIERPIADAPLSDEPVESISRLIERPAPNRQCVPRWFGR
jgi:hypothetical protein